MSNPFEAMALREEEFRFAKSNQAKQAKVEYDEARRDLRQFRSRLIKPSEEELEAAQAAVDEARAAYDSHFVIIMFHQNDSARHVYEQRYAERAKRWKGKTPKGYEWWTDPEGAEVHLIAGCARDLGWAPEQWVAELAQERWSAAQRSALLNSAMEANNRIAYDVGKD